ncbi:hypothetical protein ACIBKY_51500 [Nonomuraea sp. NPDC050394]|uniref:hypothetical protein n=1 Tax=Nonomuraea sp. NPDC050394 TaxID=3364363 RepID=UPI0037985F27
MKAGDTPRPRWLKVFSRDTDTRGVLHDAGEVGGDVQATPSYSVRYTARERPGAVVTVYFYGQRTGARTYEVGWQVEKIICRDVRDPGGTEEWSAAEYGPSAEEAARSRPFRQAAHAEVAAQRLAREHRPEMITWNGIRPESR